MSDKKATVRMTLNYSDFYYLTWALGGFIENEGIAWNEDLPKHEADKLFKDTKAILSRLEKNWKRIGYKRYVPPK
eukprot:COSAG04_NODE_399_length_14959_cov_28.238730_3_plen_75_part_00